MTARVLLILCLIVAVPAVGQMTDDQIVGITPLSEDTVNCGNNLYSIAVSKNGDLFRFHPVQAYGEPAWTLIGNIWDLTGESQSSEFCGVARWYTDESSLLAITKDGQSFYKIGGEWLFEGRIGDLSGRPQASSFATLVKGHFTCAITESGELYERSSLVGAWVFSGSIEEDTGIVDSSVGTIDGFKAMFHR